MDKRTVTAAVLASVVLACSEPVAMMAGAAMQDAGAMMQQAGAGMSAAGMGGLGGVAGAAGEMLADAGSVLAGSGGAGEAGSGGSGTSGGGDGGSAMAQPVEPTIIESSCTAQYGRRTTQMDGSWSENVQFYAEVDIAGMTADDLAGAVAVMCDYTTTQVPAPMATCNTGGVTCTDIGGGYPAPQADCSIQNYIEVIGSKARINCGYNIKTSSGNSEQGYKWSSVKFIIP